MDVATRYVDAAFHFAQSPPPYYNITSIALLLGGNGMSNLYDQFQWNTFLLSLGFTNEKYSDERNIRKLYAMCNCIEQHYHVFQIKKRTGKMRAIYHPKPSLKYIQRNILRNILEHEPISKYATAYHKGIHLKDNALPHVNKKIILKLDIVNFFEYIRFFDVYQSCFSELYFPKAVGMLLTQLCTYEDYLPQGAPTSAYISNLVMREFDNEIGTWCERQHITYTRYSDDMTFSGDFDPAIVVKQVRNRLRKLGLELNKQKIHVIRGHSCQQVTGIVVNEKAQVTAAYRKKIRQELYYLKRYGLKSHLERICYNDSPETYLATLYGKIEYVLQINEHDQEFMAYKKYMQAKMK